MYSPNNESDFEHTPGIYSTELKQAAEGCLIQAFDAIPDLLHSMINGAALSESPVAPSVISFIIENAMLVVTDTIPTDMLQDGIPTRREIHMLSEGDDASDLDTDEGEDDM